MQIALGSLELAQQVNLQSNAKQVIYKGEKQFHLAWKLILFSEKPLIDCFYMIDAHIGAILEKSSRLTNYVGDGDVYPTHPGLSSATNKTLYELDGNGRLHGTYVFVENDEGPEAYSATNSFTYSPGNTHFDEVNIYYHVNRFRMFFVNQFDNGSIDFEFLRAYAHYNDPVDGDIGA